MGNTYHDGEENHSVSGTIALPDSATMSSATPVSRKAVADKDITSMQSPQAHKSVVVPRTSRNKERISYADFYKIGSKNASIAHSPGDAEPVKDRSNILRLKVKQATSTTPLENSNTQNADQNGKPAQNNTLVDTKVHHIETASAQSAEDVKPRASAPQPLERLPTSPLSSILSDIGAEDDDSSTFETNSANLADIGYNDISSFSLRTGTFLAPGKKRMAMNEASRSSDKKSKKNKKIKIRFVVPKFYTFS